MAVSGGADSVCLLLLLWVHFPHRRQDIYVLHVQHGLRGEASLAEARFVAELAESLGLAYREGTLAPLGLKKVTEDALRQARFHFLEKHMRLLGARVLLLGHHAGDVAENLLLRLGRGAGLAGLSGLRPVQTLPTHLRLRPLLSLDPDKIKNALQTLQLPWCQDASNAQNVFLRNRLRNSVVPAWKQAFEGRSLLEGVLRSRNLLQEAHEAIDFILEQRGITLKAQRLEVHALQGLPVAALRRALETWLWQQFPEGQPLNARAFETLLQALIAAKPFKMSAGRGFIFLQNGYMWYGEKAL